MLSSINKKAICNSIYRNAKLQTDIQPLIRNRIDFSCNVKCVTRPGGYVAARAILLSHAILSIQYKIR